ncbi:hypothetical protein [Streptomyces sp. MP131-18]|uniref:hypothetical protein n=1 Tax=Streptomyces sp. MP131-18 TaxID=1857892 RepID=UPI00097BC9C9|nr:hypothetical protein [Streptomyces sp. MP131-18]ONK10395.1 hypothetical protein STBA_11170 [Streptomyces sp. MP131-18]
MSTYTLGTPEMLAHVIRELPERYEMSLTPTDMEVIVTVLAAQAGFVEISEDMQDRAASMFANIAEMLGIEGV